MNNGPGDGDRAAPGWQVWLALWTVYIVWGSTYLAIRVLVRTMPPLLAAGGRFVIAGAVIYAWVRWRRGPVPLRARELAAAALVGTLLAAGGNGLVSLAEREVPSSLAALLIASVPLWVIVLRALAREHPPRGTLVGVGVGFVGVALLLLPGHLPRGVGIAGLVLMLVAAVSWATGSFASGRLALPSDPLRSAGVQMLFGGAVLTVGGLARGEAGGLDLSAFSAESVAAFTYLVVAGSIAFTAYVWLLQHAPISKVATYAYVNPVIAVFLGWAVLAEPISTATLAGAAVIVASVAFIVRKESPPEAREAAAGRDPAAGEELERAAA